MRLFVKKYIKPIIKIPFVFTQLHRAYFFVVSLRTILTNLFLRTFSKTAPILLYHRIATVSEDPISLCVSPESFENHLVFLKKNYNLIPLSKLSERLLNGTLLGNEMAITFDDGYRDNMLNALPLLEKYNVSATIFITTGMLGQTAAFEWDKEYREKDRASFLSNDEIQRLAKHPLIEIGAHTNTHRRLSDLTTEEQRNDISVSKKILEDITSKEITLFAYPFGGIHDFSKVTEKIVEELGFRFAYSNNQSLATNTNRRFNIARINIRQSTSLKRLK